MQGSDTLSQDIHRNNRTVHNYKRRALEKDCAVAMQSAYMCEREGDIESSVFYYLLAHTTIEQCTKKANSRVS